MDEFYSIPTWLDPFTKRVHFLKWKTTETAVDVINAFFANIFKLHGLPDKIVLDRDRKFKSQF